MTLRNALAAAALAVPLAVLSSPAAHALECPAAAGTATPAEAEAIEAALRGGAAFQDFGWLREAATELVAKGVRRTTLVDTMIADYCPSVAADSALSEAEKSAAIRSFAARLTQIAYGGDAESAVILDVPLPPEVIGKIDAQARSEGLSPEAWVAKAAEDALD